MVYGSPGKAYASPHAPAMAPLSTALIGDIDTALASGDPAAALLQLMLKNPRQIGQIAAYVRKKDPNLETIVDGAPLGHHPMIARLAATTGRRMMEAQVHMGHGDNERNTLKERRADLTKEMHEARDAGDNEKARRLDAERGKLTTELYGNGAIVGDQGRSV